MLLDDGSVAIYRHNADSERITPPTQRTIMYIVAHACVLNRIHIGCPNLAGA